MQLKQVDLATESLDEALAWVAEFTAKGEAKSIALLGNAAEIHWQILEKGIAAGQIEANAKNLQSLGDAWLHARELERALPPLKKAA